jgi:hypothetical protein
MGRPTALRNARSRPTAPPRAGSPQVPGPPTQRRVGCRRSRSHPRPGQNPGTRGPSRESQGLLARPVPRGCRVRRGPRPRRPTSAVRGRAKRARAARVPRAGLLCRVAAGRAALAGSAQAPPRAVPTRRVRVARVRGRLRRGLRDQVLPGRVRPGQVDPVRVRALRVPARGRATTRSVRPRPAWGRRLRLGPRAQAHLVSRAVPGPRRAPPAAPAAPVARVRPDAGLAGPVRPMADRVPADPGRAR